jgi:hypothetical protein
MDPSNVHAKFRGAAAGESTRSDLPFQFAGPAPGARFHMYAGRMVLATRKKESKYAFR